MAIRWLSFTIIALTPTVFGVAAAPGQPSRPDTGGRTADGPAASAHDRDRAPTSRPAAEAGAKVIGTIGYVDLDRVSAQINWKSEFDNDLHAAKNEAERQLTVFKDSVLAAWEAKKKDIASAAHLNAEQVKTLNSMNGQEIQKLPLTQAQKDDLAQSFLQANQALTGAQQKANQAISQREQKILESFREAMRPSVRRVAMAANISMVIAPPPNANPVFYYDPSVDLTDRVVDDMRKAMPQHNLPEMPKLNLPTEFHFSAGLNSPPKSSTGGEPGSGQTNP